MLEYLFAFGRHAAGSPAEVVGNAFHAQRISDVILCPSYINAPHNTTDIAPPENPNTNTIN